MLRKNSFLTFMICSTILFMRADSQGGLGGCPALSPNITVDTEAFAGRWYIQALNYKIFTDNFKCSYCDMTLSSHKTYYKVYPVLITQALGIPVPLYEEVRLSNSNMPENSAPKTSTILDTDYENYAVGFACADIFFGTANLNEIFVISRSHDLNPEDLEKIKRVLADNGLNDEIYMMPQNNCYS